MNKNRFRIYNKINFKPTNYFYNNEIIYINEFFNYLIIKFLNEEILIFTKNLEIIKLEEINYNDYIKDFQETKSLILFKTNNKNRIIYEKLNLKLIKIENKNIFDINFIKEFNNYFIIQTNNKRIIFDKLFSKNIYLNN